MIGSPDKPKLDKSTKTYYTYDIKKDGEIDFSTIELTDDDRERAINDLMQTQQFDHLLYSETRLNDRRALWQDCVGEMMGEDGKTTFGKNVEWDGSKEQLNTLHQWLAETAIDQNLAPGARVTGMKRRSKSGSGSSGFQQFTYGQQRNMMRYQDQYDKNKQLVNDLFTAKDEMGIGKFEGQGNKASRRDVLNILNEKIDFRKDDKFILGEDVKEKGMEGEEDYISNEDRENVYFIKNGKRLLVPVDFSNKEELFDFVNKETIGNDEVIYNLGLINTGDFGTEKTDTSEKEKSGELDNYMDELEKLYNVLSRDGYYTKSFDDFKSQYKDEKYRDKVYDIVSRDGLYTKSKDEFQNKYTVNIETPELVEVEETDVITSPVSEDKEMIGFGIDVGEMKEGKPKEKEFSFEDLLELEKR